MTTMPNATRKPVTEATAALTESVSAGNPIGRMRRTLARRVSISATVVVAALVGMIGLGGIANASVYTGPGHAPYASEQWGDCHILVGAVRTSNGAAMGGADVRCDHYRGTISVTVTLFRYTAATGWVSYGTPWYTVHNNYALSVHTGGVCGGDAWWLTRTYVYVDGSETHLDSTSKASEYNPPC